MRAGNRFNTAIAQRRIDALRATRAVDIYI